MPVSPALEEKYRRTTRFWPATRNDPEGPLTRPAMQTAGVFVFAYVEENTLVVSIDLDTVHRGLVERPGTTATVPLHITVQGVTVFYAPSERSGHTAWRVVGPGGEITLFADDEVRSAERLADTNGGRLEYRQAGESDWVSLSKAPPPPPRRWWRRILRAVRAGRSRWHPHRH